MKVKSAVNKPWRSKVRYTVNCDNTSVLLYDGKQVCVDFILDSVTVSYLIRYDRLLQNETDIIIKCDSYFIAKYNRSLLQNAAGFYYKMRQLLQISTILLQNATVITKCDVYYKLRQYKNCIKKFFTSVREHATNVINFEKTANKDSSLTKKS